VTDGHPGHGTEPPTADAPIQGPAQPDLGDPNQLRWATKLFRHSTELFQRHRQLLLEAAEARLTKLRQLA
jgi:hypothetical protein